MRNLGHCSSGLLSSDFQVLVGMVGRTEVWDVVQSLRMGKVPGSDGLLTEFDVFC